MKWFLAIPLFLAGCTAMPDQSPAVFEVHKPRQSPPLPALADSATLAERTAFTRTVVLMYAQCAKGE